MAKSRRTWWAWTVGTFFGAGFGKPGPGTYGSCAAALLWWGGARLLQPSAAMLTLLTLAVAVLATLVGIPAATRVARESGRKDPSIVVIDEVAGQLFTLLLAAPTLPQVLLAVVLFRVFDISKPWPIRKLEALPEGTGIMLDDVAAGLLGLAVFVLTALTLQHFGVWRVA